MQKRKTLLPVLALALVMLVLVAYAAWTQSGDLLGKVRFQDSVRQQELDLFYDQDSQSYVLFLPAYVSPGDVSYSSPAGVQVAYSTGMLEQAALSQTLEMTVTAPFARRQYTLRLEQCSALPTVFIEAEEGLLEYLHADKKNTRDVVVNMVDGEGNTLLHSTSTMYGRGNGSWESPSKRPYNLEFKKEVSVGPFEGVTKLCLLADFSDESKLRNSLAYYAGQELGIDYASAYQHVNLYVNGEYIGLYGIVTKQEYKKHIQEDNIQAVFEIASNENPVEFFSSQGFRINVMYGSKAKVERLVNGLEEALVQGDWEGCADYIDVSSFARKYAMEEFLANLDLAYASQYFYLDEKDIIHCMLPWDYDWTLGSSFDYYNNRQVSELKVRRNSKCWYGQLIQRQEFRQQLVAVLETEFSDAFLAKLETHLARDIDAIRASWACDILRWENEPAYHQFDLASGVEDLPGFLDLFRSYFPQRRAFLTDYFRSPEDYCSVRLYDARSAHFYVPKGTDLGTFLEGATVLDVRTPGEKFLGWYLEDDRTPDEVGAVTEDISIRGYYEELTTQSQKLSSYWVELGVVAAFGVVALAVFAAACRGLRRKSKV